MYDKMLLQLEFNAELLSTCLMGGMSPLPDGAGAPAVPGCSVMDDMRSEGYQA